jgi:protein-L-isoaspartate(D-aspartate) O-methyltransferase
VKPAHVTTPEELAIIRRAYAKQVKAAAGADNPAVERAFATVPREDFLGPGPWQIPRDWGNYTPTPSADPVYLYTNDLVGIIPERHINNGQPSLHFYLLARAAPAAGEHIVHVGAGVGYYTAIMADITGPDGKVTGIEYDPDLAARARANLLPYPQADVIEGDGSSVPFEDADIIYINAGATRPAEAWLDRLRPGGRLVLPLTTDLNFSEDGWNKMRQRGAVFLITRREGDYDAEWISPVAIFPCVGTRDEASERPLAAALERGNVERVRKLYRSDAIPEEHCWLKAPGWCLAYD